MKMDNQIKTEKKKYKTTDPNLFFQFKIKAIKDDLILSFLSGTELKVILAISSFINHQNKAYPSQKHLSRLTGLSVSTVSRNVSRLSSKKFQGSYVLQTVKEREEGSRFGNNRYYVSPKIGISFGSIDHKTKTQKSIVHNNQTNNNNTLNKNQILKNNNRVISFKKKVENSNSKFLQIHELFTEEEEETFHFYAKVISKDKPFKGDIEYAQRVLTKNIEAMGLENWKDLTKILQNHPKPKAILNHIRYSISQKGLTYDEAWKEWDRKY